MSTPAGNNNKNGNDGGPASNVEARAPTTSMGKVRPADRGEAPATEPGAVRRESDMSNVSGLTTGTGQTTESRRDARRSKRAATREKMNRASVDGTMARNPVVAAPGEARSSLRNQPYVDDEDDDEDDEDGVDDDVPGSFAVAGPATRRSLQLGDGKPSAIREDDTIVQGGGDENDDNKNLPVAFEAEVVFDYPSNNNIVVAQKDDSDRSVPLKWLIICGCIFLVAAVAISVGLGVALGGGPPSSTSASASAVAPKTAQPAQAPSSSPSANSGGNASANSPPTFTPVVSVLPVIHWTVFCLCLFWISNDAKLFIRFVANDPGSAYFFASGKFAQPVLQVYGRHPSSIKLTRYSAMVRSSYSTSLGPSYIYSCDCSNICTAKRACTSSCSSSNLHTSGKFMTCFSIRGVLARTHPHTTDLCFHFVLDDF